VDVLTETRVPVTFRKAAPGDREAVLALSARLPNDWIPYEIDNMLRAERGGLYVAEANGRLAALCNAFITGDQAWLQAMRVDPDLHNRGIATTFTSFLLDQCGFERCRLARLSTDISNHTVHHLVGGKLGFRRLGRWVFFDLEEDIDGLTAPPDVSAVRPGLPADLDPAWDFLEGRFRTGAVKPVRLAPPHSSPWLLADLDRGVLEEHLRAGRVLLSFGGSPAAVDGIALWSFLTPDERPAQVEDVFGTGWMGLQYIEGSQAVAAALFAAAIAAGVREGAGSMVLSLAGTQWETLRGALRPDWPQGGFAMDAVIYQKDLG
jgi:GNAT superfamily N-acetyltransferase